MKLNESVFSKTDLNDTKKHAKTSLDTLNITINGLDVESKKNDLQNKKVDSKILKNLSKKNVSIKIVL